MKWEFFLYDERIKAQFFVFFNAKITDTKFKEQFFSELKFHSTFF